MEGLVFTKRDLADLRKLLSCWFLDGSEVLMLVTTRADYQH